MTVTRDGGQVRWGRCTSLPQPVPGSRITYSERRRLRTARRGVDTLIRQLLDRGVPAAWIAEAVR